MTPPEVTVVMAVRNGCPYLRAATESILAQTLRDFAFVIVDDGSSDGTPQVLAALASRDRRVRVVTRPPRNLVEALNEACELARTPYIARMDADDIAHPSRMEAQLEAFHGSSKLGLLGTAARLIDADGGPLGTLAFPAMDGDIRQLLEKENAFVHPSVMFRRDVFVEVGGYRRVAAHAEDYDLWLRIAEVAQLANLDQKLLDYRVHAQSVTGANLRQQALSMLGARAAADVRKTGGRDPLDDADIIDLDLLAELGVDGLRLQAGVEDSYIARARFEHRSGRPDEALTLVAAARDLLDDAGVAGPRARLDLNEAFLRLATRSYRAGSALLLQAFVRAPGATLARLARALRRSARREGRSVK